MTEFDEAVFTKMVVEIRVPENGTLIFILRDGTEITEIWENKSRRDSWSPEMKQQAREHALRHNHRKGGAE